MWMVSCVSDLTMYLLLRPPTSFQIFDGFVSCIISVSVLPPLFLFLPNLHFNFGVEFVYSFQNIRGESQLVSSLNQVFYTLTKGRVELSDSAGGDVEVAC